jgi:hypothetical protein
MKSIVDILHQFRIGPTDQRITILKLILDAEKGPFSIHELEKRMNASDLPISHNTLVITLQLFVTRKVLRAFPTPKTEKKKGRPLMLYVIDPALTLIRSTLPLPQVSETLIKSENTKGFDFSAK